MQFAVTPSDDDAHDYGAVLAEPYPCENCRHAGRCKASLEACAAFSLYVAHAGELRWRAAPRIPGRECFDAIFAEASPAKAQTPKRPRLLTAEERRQRNTLRKQRWRQHQQKQQQARDAA
jgi:hypothetical protein